MDKVCQGYKDLKGVQHSCNLVLMRTPEGTGVTHGLCSSCERAVQRVAQLSEPQALRITEETSDQQIASFVQRTIGRILT